MRLSFALLAVVFITAVGNQVSAATVNFVETSMTRLSTNGNFPTLLGTFGVGLNTVTGNVSGAQLSIANGRNSDIFTFVIGQGTQLDSLTVSNYSGSNISYAAMTRGTPFPLTNTILNNLDPPTNNFTGIGLIGFSDGTVLFDQNSNDFGLFATFYGSPGFTAPLGPDTYSFYVQETNQGGGPATYTMNFSVSAIPEPSSFAVLGLASMGAVMRRRRRA